MKNSVDLIKNYIKDSPEKPGVYQMYQDSNIIYIGKAKNLKKRIGSYANYHNLSKHIKIMVTKLTKIEIILTQNEIEALILEANLIKKHLPKYNILLKDNKSFPYIKITNHNYPRITYYTGKINQTDKFFGPFTSKKQLYATINNIHKIFKLRSCSDSFFKHRTKPCLEFQINRCSAPCVQKISTENYQKTVNDVISFLSGKSRNLQESLIEKMQEYSEKQEYEKAIQYREIIKNVNFIQEHQNIQINNHNNIDFLALYNKNGLSSFSVTFIRNGQNCGSYSSIITNHSDDYSENAASILTQLYDKYPIPSLIVTEYPIKEESNLLLLLKKLFHSQNLTIKTYLHNSLVQKQLFITKENAKNHLLVNVKKEYDTENLHLQLKILLKLETIPNKIEIFDNSHSYGKQPVGFKAVVDLNGTKTNDYRQFNFPAEINTDDDYAMMDYMLNKSLSKVTDNNKPDLLIIDGGIGHLNIAKKIVEKYKLNIEIIAISKGVERIPGQEKYYNIKNEEMIITDLKLLSYMQHIRDKAHFGALKRHRKKRDKNSILSSKLTNIKGIGKQKSILLLKHFGSLSDVKNTSLEQLMMVKGINKELAKNILSYFSDLK